MVHCRSCKAGAVAFFTECPQCKAINTCLEGPAPLSPLGWVESQHTIPRRIGDVTTEKVTRISSGTRELDRVLGGGIVPGGIILVTADPGFGKSTLLLQTIADLSVAEATVVKPDGKEEKTKLVCMYVSGEEMASQIKSRQERISPEATEFLLFIETDVSRLETELIRIKPDILVVDSVQRMWTPGVDGAAGSVTQVRESAAHLVRLCKAPALQTAVFLVGHVVKDGSMAGPMTLAHLVDTIVEGTKEGPLRILRASKNRFGNADEAAIFKMGPTGLRSIDNPVEIFQPGRGKDSSGSCLALGMLGRRAVTVEIQTLLSPSASLNSAGKRYARGISDKRLVQVMAVLRARTLLPTQHAIEDMAWRAMDLHASIAGGLTLGEDAGLDLPLALAIASSVVDEAMPENTAALGEIGLAGELRKPDDWEARLKQARIMGMGAILGPELGEEEMAELKELEPEAAEVYQGFETIGEVLSVLGWASKRRPRKRAEGTKKRSKKP